MITWPAVLINNNCQAVHCLIVGKAASVLQNLCKSNDGPIGCTIALVRMLRSGFRPRAELPLGCCFLWSCIADISRSFNADESTNPCSFLSYFLLAEICPVAEEFLSLGSLVGPAGCNGSASLKFFYKSRFSKHLPKGVFHLLEIKFYSGCLFWVIDVFNEML